MAQPVSPICGRSRGAAAATGPTRRSPSARRWAAFEAPDGIADLCCGLAGRAYAALAAYKVTGEDAWLARGRDLAERAAVGVRRYALRRDSLYKGEVGVAVLAADLERPLESSMPAFEAEAWVRRATDPAPRHVGSDRRDQP